MAVQGRTPSSEFAKPLTRQDIKPIADEVEKRFNTGTIAAHPVPQEPKHRHPHSEVDEEQERRLKQAEGSSIQAGEVQKLLSAATEALVGVAASNLAESDLREPSPEEIIKALRVEEKIIKNNPHLAMQLRLDEQPWILGVENTKLLPDESDNWQQRRAAFNLHTHLAHQIEKAREKGAQFTAQEVLDYIERYNQREIPLLKEHDAKLAQEGIHLHHPPVTIKELFATAERHLLQTYKFQQSGREMGEHYVLYAHSVNILHGLLEDILVTQTRCAASDAQQHATPE